MHLFYSYSSDKHSSHTPQNSATLMSTLSRFIQVQNEDDDKNKGRMEIRIVWNNNESHFTLSSAQNDDSIHNFNNKFSLPENRKSTHPNFTLLSFRGSSLLYTHTSFVPHSYLVQSFSLADSQSIIPCFPCLSSSNLYCFLRIL